MKRTTFRAVAALVAVAVATTIAGCTTTPADDDVERTLTLPISAIVNAGWDPVQGSYIGELSHHAVFDTLVSYAADGSVIPKLATGYVVADDKLSMEITLRDDVDFVDGAHLDAAVVEAFYDNILGPDSAYLGKGLMDPYGMEFTATGDYTLELTFTSPIYHPAFKTDDPIRQLFAIPVLSPAALDDPERAKVEPMGSGPYVIDEMDSDVEISFVRNPDYWDPEAYPYDRIVLKVISDPIAQLNALKSGQISAAGIPVEYAAEAEESGLTLVSTSDSYWALMIRDVVASPIEPLRDIRVRQAMSLAFDREAIAEELDLGYGRASSQAFVEGQPEYIEGGDDRYAYDLDKARALMAEAGYADGFDLPIPTEAGQAAVQPIITQSLADIGIRADFEVQADSGAFFVAAMGGSYPVTLLFFGNTQTLSFLDYDLTGLGRFFAPNEELSELLEVVRFGDAEESAAASQELGEKVLDEVWYLPFSRPAVIQASEPSVTINTEVDGLAAYGVAE